MRIMLRVSRYILMLVYIMIIKYIYYNILYFLMKIDIEIDN